MSQSDDFSELDATAQAELVRNREVKPIELVDAAISRIERLNPRINAVITPMFDQAREAAKGKLPEGPFKGVPFLLKDLVAEYQGARFAEGTAFSGEYLSQYDSELVIRHKRAGLIVLGKTNVPELGILPTTEPKRFGPCRNPWDPDRSTGGSSGGSAAAAAARMVPMAHGNDGGGSIRIPASACGVFGLKPTRNRNTLAPEYGELVGGFVCEHGLTVSVRDSAALLDATSGPGVGDPYFAPPPERPFLQEVGADPGKLRIGWMDSAMTGVPVHEDCVKAVHDTVELCRGLGHTLEEASLDIDGQAATQAALSVMFASFAWEKKTKEQRYGKKAAPESFEPLTWAIIKAGEKYSAVDYMISVQTLHQISRQVQGRFEEYDLVLTPTMAALPARLGEFDAAPENPMLPLIKAANFIPFTSICNITGQPAMSVPLYWTGEGLPVGSHFIGRYGGEALLFRLAAQLEEARPWKDKRPPLSV